jgi:hypothetical protein
MQSKAATEMDADVAQAGGPVLKLLLVLLRGPIRHGPRIPTSKGFLLLFFKKEVLPYLFFTGSDGTPACKLAL